MPAPSRAPQFHDLAIARVAPEAADAVSVTFTVPEELRDAFRFAPGQFLTLRAHVGGREERRSYSICSSRDRFERAGELEVGIKPVQGGVFSNWAARELRAGARLSVMTPDGRFTPRAEGARHRVGFAAGSGITPMLSIIASTLAEDRESSFTLVYGNQRTHTIMFNEVLQDLKDRWPTRLALVHVLSRQPQEVSLLNGRLDEAKVGELLETLIPAASIDEAFICGPEGMIDGVERALAKAGVAPERIHAERFFTDTPRPARAQADDSSAATRSDATQPAAEGDVALEVVLDGKTHAFRMRRDAKVLDVALAGGLDLPWSCKGGVCCTCRARVVEGQVEMERNYTLESWEMDKGFVLTCQSMPRSDRVVVSYDER